MFPPECRHLLVRPWFDPTVDKIGHDPRSPYVERFWLGTLGPSVTWFLRYVADQFDATPDGFDLDLASCARALGLGQFQGRGAALPRTVARCCQFDAARMVNRVTLGVRRKLPPLNARQLERLPEGLRREHARTVGVAPPSLLGDHARRLAVSLLELGEGAVGVERQLRRWRFPDELARAATEWAFDRCQARPA
jgi:hypothetical protein